MDDTKPTLTSKTVITSLIGAILNALVFFGVISADLGLSLEQTAGTLAGLNVVGYILTGLFRKAATARLG